MPSLDLKAIQNTKHRKHAKNNIETIQTGENLANLETMHNQQPIVSSVDNNFSEIMKNILKNDSAKKLDSIENSDAKTPKETIDVSKFLDKSDEKQLVVMNEYDKNKTIALLNLYIAEFPEKLSKYKNKNFNNMKDKELIELKDVFHREVTSSNQLGVAVEASKKALQLYEFTCCNLLDVNIKGASKVGDSDEWAQAVKACALRHMDSMTLQTEPEYKLMFLILTSSLMAHQNNTLHQTKETINSIETKTNIVQQPVHQSVNPIISEQDDIIKKLKLKDINNKFSDL